MFARVVFQCSVCTSNCISELTTCAVEPVANGIHVESAVPVLPSAFRLSVLDKNSAQLEHSLPPEDQNGLEPERELDLELGIDACHVGDVGDSNIPALPAPLD